MTPCWADRPDRPLCAQNAWKNEGEKDETMEQDPNDGENSSKIKKINSPPGITEGGDEKTGCALGFNRLHMVADKPGTA